MATDKIPIGSEVERVASELERQLNTGHRVYVVDRQALSRTYWRIAAAMTENHDPGDEDRA